jgi:hypothetical protein
MHYLKQRYSQFINKKKDSKLNSQIADNTGQDGKHDEELSIESNIQDEIELSRKFDEQFLVRIFLKY